ncbi:glycosyltransferase family 4 protein [Microcoleus sp. F8-D3]
MGNAYLRSAPYDPPLNAEQLSQLSFAQIAELYQAADVYVSPYLTEGFNLQVLEAVACGLPIICTAGGPADDFTSNFALQIESKFTAVASDGETLETATE